MIIHPNPEETMEYWNNIYNQQKQIDKEHWLLKQIINNTQENTMFLKKNLTF